MSYSPNTPFTHTVCTPTECHTLYPLSLSRVLTNPCPPIPISFSRLPPHTPHPAVLGPTDPKAAPEGALRGMILKDWVALGLSEEPNTGDNCVHASASPFEALAERMNWLKADITKDAFGAMCLAAGIPAATLKEWSVDPQVKGKSIFDQLEDLDVEDCLAKMVELAQ
jgi:hypothetical protein